VYGPAAIGIVLTGNLDDGTSGLYAIRQMGGITVVQDPDDAMYPSMPLSAARHVQPDFCVPLEEMAPLLVRIVETPLHAAPRPAPSELLEREVEIAKEQNAIATVTEHFGQPSPYACPECHGVLWQKEEAGRRRYRCHTGHAYSTDALLESVREASEEAMWNAVRSLNEAGILARHLSEHSDDARSAAEFRKRAAEAQRRADAIRELITARQAAMKEP
jgi:two-component system chemotaxis response regulator CheB